MNELQTGTIQIGCAFITFDFRTGSVLNFYENITSKASDKLAMKVLVSGFNGSKNIDDYYGENITTLTDENIIAYSYLFPVLTKVNGDDLQEPRPNALTISFPLSEHSRVYRLAPSIKNLLVSIAQEIQENFVYGQKLSDKIKERLRLCMDIDYLEKNSKIDISYISSSIPSLGTDSDDNGPFEDYYDIPELTTKGTNALITSDTSLITLIGENFKSIIREVNGLITIRSMNNKLNTQIEDLMTIFNLLREKGFVSKLSEAKKICIVFEDLYNELAISVEGLKKGKSKKMFEDTLAKQNHSIFWLIRYDSYDKISFQGVIQFLKSNSSELTTNEMIKLLILPISSIISSLEKFYGKNLINNLKKSFLMNLAQKYGYGDIYSALKSNFEIKE